MQDPSFTHLDSEGRARMVDVSAKAATHRRAVAEAILRMEPDTLERIRAGTVQKGDALAVARIAAIQGAKRTADWVPLCHPVRLDHVGVAIEFVGAERVRIRVEARALDRTGVEMEALTGAAAAALALYDMIKGVDRGALVETLRLLTKEGGKSGRWERPGSGGA